jgi:hypothetical protein
MRPTGRIVVTRARLDGVIRRVTTLRARLAAARDLQRGGDLAHRMLRLFDAGPDISREDAERLFTLAPLYDAPLLRMYLRSADKVVQSRWLLLRQKKIGPALEPLLRRHWQLSWRLGHLAIASFQDAGRYLKESLRQSAQRLPSSLSLFAWRTGLVGTYVRALHATAKAGTQVLGDYKQLYRSCPRDLARALDYLLALAAIGMRHRHERTEIVKLVRTQPFVGDDAASRCVRTLAQAIHPIFEAPESLESLHRAAGRKLAVQLGSRFAPGSALRFEHEHDVPDELAMPLALRSNRHLYTPEGVIDAFTLLPWTTRAAPQDLYIPAEYLPLVKQPWDRHSALRLVEATRPSSPPPAIGPSRKRPCPCGSAKKYKHCCATKPS